MVNANWDQEPIEDELDRRIKSDEPPDPPDDLPQRCLARIHASGLVTVRPKRAGGVFRYRGRVVMSGISVAAAVVVACLALLRGSAGPNNVLAEVIRAFQQAPAYHVTRTEFEPGGTEPARIEETWAVRGVGRRIEVRQASKLAAVVVDNMRWRFIWDPDRDCVIAWPSDLADPSARISDDAVLSERESLLRWADRHKADAVPEKHRLDGKEVEKITLRWPGEIPMGTHTVWFDPGTRRPLKKRYESAEGRITEIMIDYPAPETVPKQQFEFQVPRSATLEVNDPQLGRPLYAEGQTLPDLRKSADTPAESR